MSDDVKNSWICSDCVLALCWAYGFRKMCLDVKSKLEMVFNNTELCVKEEVIDEEEANFIHIKSEPEEFSDADCTHTLVEVEESDPLEIQSEEHALLQHACNTIPELKEKNTLPENFKCQVKLERLNIKRRFKRKNAKRSSRANSLKGVFCSICTTRFCSSTGLIKHLKTRHNKTVNSEPVKCNKKRVAPKSIHKPRIGSIHIDFITDKFESFTVQKSFRQPASRGTQGILPYKLPAKPKTQIHSAQNKKDKTTSTKNETPQLLRKAVMNLKQIDTSTIDVCETNPHGNFGISVIPSYPVFETTGIHLEKSFVGEEVLNKNMTDYVLSILRESNPDAVMSLPPASELFDPRRKQHGEPQENKKTDQSDHTYSLFSRDFNETCIECGFTFDMVELFDYHFETYHAGWFLLKGAGINIRTRAWENYYKCFDSDETNSAGSDLEKMLDNNTQRKTQRKRKRFQTDGKRNNKKSDSETDTADEETEQCNGNVDRTEQKARVELCTIQESEKSFDPFENCENVHVLHTTYKIKAVETDNSEQVSSIIKPVEHQTSNKNPSRKVIVHQVQIFKNGVEVRDQTTLDLQASKRENLKPTSTDENIQQKEEKPPKGCNKEFNIQRQFVSLEKSIEHHTLQENFNKAHSNLDQFIVHQQTIPIVLPTETIQDSTNQNILEKRLDHERLLLTPESTSAKEPPNKLESVNQQIGIPLLIPQHGENVTPLLQGPPLHLLSSTPTPQQNPLYLLVSPSATTKQSPLITNNIPVKQSSNVVPNTKPAKRKKKKKTRVRTYYILSTSQKPNSNVVLLAAPNDNVIANQACNSSKSKEVHKARPKKRRGGNLERLMNYYGDSGNMPKKRKTCDNKKSVPATAESGHCIITDDIDYGLKDCLRNKNVDKRFSLRKEDKRAEENSSGKAQKWDTLGELKTRVISENAMTDKVILDINAVEHLKSVEQRLQNYTTETATKDELKEKVIDAVDIEIELSAHSGRVHKQLSETALQD